MEKHRQEQINHNPYPFITQKTTSLILSQPAPPKLNPFPLHSLTRILTAPEYLPTSQTIPTTQTDYIRQFEFTAGTQNLFPILLDITQKIIYVCSKDCFVIFSRDDPTRYEKVKLPEMPTCFVAAGQLLYFGLRSGSIVIYNAVNKTTLVTCEEFQFPVVQIQVLDQDRFMAMDSMGNLKLMVLAIKIFMDRIVKVSISATDIIEQFRIKKRDKLKNFVKSLPFRRQKQKQKQKQQQGQQKQTSQQSSKRTQSSSSQSLAKNQLQKQLPKFCILNKNNKGNRDKNQNQNYNQNEADDKNISLVYYYKGQLKSYTLDQKYRRIGEFVIFRDLDGKIGMLELGQGGFSNSNQSHRVLAVSIDNCIRYYRQLTVQTNHEYLLITEIKHEHKILTGKFISNNLILFLTQQGIQISNVNGPLQLVNKIQFDKFGYIDFFIQEEGFDFDKRLLYSNIVRAAQDENGDCIWVCLEGKRLLFGVVMTWKNYLNTMVQQGQWEKCLKSGLMIYKDKLTLLASIPQRLQQRNDEMRLLFQRITLTYISYSLKNSTQLSEHTQILKNAIDFMVRTECFTYLSTIFQASKGYGLEKVFLQQLEEYVESGSIKWMGEDLLLSIVKHYTEVNIQSAKQQPQQPTSQPQLLPQQPDQMPANQHPKQSLSPKKSSKQIETEINLAQNRRHLETMIMNFDLNKMQKSLLLFICLNNELYRCLIHVCKEQKDYVTPIIKLCGLRVSKTDQMQREIKKGSGPAVMMHLLSQLDKLTQILFHYLVQCLLGHNTEHNNTKNYLEMLQQLISFIFIPSSIIMLLQASPYYTFQLLNMICGARVMQYVLENANSLIVKGGVKFGEEGASLEKELSVCRYWYYRKQSKQVGKIEHQAIFSGGHSSEQFSIYNNMLSTLTKTILEYYQKHHNPTPILQPLSHPIITKKTPQNSLPLTLTVPVTYKQPELTNIQLQNEKTIFEKQQNYYKLSQSGLSQIYVHYLHNFILNLMISNSFPVRLCWRLLCFEFVVAYGQVQDGFAIQGIVLRLVDCVMRELGRMYVDGEVFGKNCKQCLNVMLNALIEKQKQHKQLVIASKCYILDMLNRQKDIIQTLLSSTNQTTKYFVFKYLQNKIENMCNNSYHDRHSFSPISSIVLDNLNMLLGLSQIQTLKLLAYVCRKLIYNNSIDLYGIVQIADQLKMYPQAQLQFIESAIKCYQQLQHQPPEMISIPLTTITKNTQQLLTRHLSTLTKHQPQNLQRYMLKMNYPLEEAFKVCEQCGNKTAMAYVLIKSGRNLEGVLLICDLFAANCREVLRNLARNVGGDGVVLQIGKMEEQLQRVLETCVVQYNNDISKGQQLFQKVLQKLFKQLNPKVIDNIPIIKIRELLQLYLNKIITITFSQVNPQFFINKFSQNPKMIAIPTRLYLKAHQLICHRLGFQYQINSIAKELLRQGDLRMYAKIVAVNGSGVAVDAQQQLCQKCGQSLYNNHSEQQLKPQKTSLSIFQCGHIYHKICLTQSQQTQNNTSPNAKTNKKKKQVVQNSSVCQQCKSVWQNVLHGQLNEQPQKYCVGVRERKKSILIQRKNKLAEYDAIDGILIKSDLL